MGFMLTFALFDCKMYEKVQLAVAKKFKEKLVVEKFFI